VLWAGFDKLDLGPSSFKHVLLLGYSNGFQVFDVEDVSSVCELVSKHDGPATFLQMQPMPFKSESIEGLRASHPLLLVVAGDETNGTGVVQGGHLSASMRENKSEPRVENSILIPTAVWFYSLKSQSYVHVLKFKSAVYMVRSSPRIVAVLFATQILCFDAVTLKQKFSVLTYPLQGAPGVNIGYGPMAVGSRWLAYASDNPLVPNSGHLTPQNLTPSPGVSPSTSPSSGNLVARYAMESSKTLAAGFRNLGDMGYKTWSKYCQEIIPDGCSSPLPSNLSRRSGRHPPTSHPSESDNAGMVVVTDFTSTDVISQFRAHTSSISALCFDPSGTLLVTASVHGHKINIFRIMPTRVLNGSSPARYNWTSVAASAAGKTFGSSGAVAAMFHNSLYHDLSQVPPKANSLEHLLVYSPSGLVIQYELLLSSFVEPCDSSLKAIPAPLLQLQEEELHVNAEPVQWWDACRRSNWPQREEDVSLLIFSNQQDSETVIDSGDCKDNASSCILSSANGLPGTESMGSERSWYFSNAEVQISSGKVPVWQKSKICFCLLDPLPAFEGCAENLTHGEIEIEKLSFNEGYCKVSGLDDCCELTEAVNDADSNSSHCECVRMNGDSELNLGGRLLERWSPGEEGVLQFGSTADSCKKVGSGAFILGAVDHSYLIILLHLRLTMPSYPPIMLAVLAMRRAFTGGGYRPYLCQVGCTTTGAPRISGRLPASDRSRWRASCPRV
ncbi:hypothetical protein B296_00039348, partial [Ensete ventricosum]